MYGDFAFVHAGIRPGVPLPEQSTKDLRTIREHFLNSSAVHEKIIVHGYTPAAGKLPERRFNRIGLDTLAYSTYRLSAGVFAEDELEFVLYTEREKARGIEVYRQSI